MAKYRTIEQFEHYEEHEHSHAISREMAALREKQEAAIRRNLHNFAQLERAGFPKTKPLEVNYWVVNRTLGFLARRAHFPVFNGGLGTRIITTLKKGYYVPRPAGGFAITTDGTVYHEATFAEERNAIEVDRAPRRGLSFQRFENPGTKLSEFKGDDKYPTCRPFASEAEIEKVRVDGTENFASSFELVAKAALVSAGVRYIPFEEAEQAETAPVEVHDGNTEVMPTIPIPAVFDDPTEVRPPNVSSPGHRLVNPLDYM